MARPRKDQQGPSAKERLSDAFWEMLGSMPYSKITVAALSTRAGVNHNTFYRHFGCIDDMAKELFDENMLPELPKKILPLFYRGQVEQGADLFDADVRFRFERARLFACSDSVKLNAILKESLTNLWLDMVGLVEDDLTQGDRDKISFIFGGLVSLLGAGKESFNPERLMGVAESSLGRGVFETLAELASGKAVAN